MNKNKFSIVIPVYNAEPYIEQCIKSILEQKYNNIEIIVVDDGSTDKSIEKIKKFEKDLIIIRQENSGVSTARNRGMLKASGDWLVFLDADDEILPNALINLNEIIEKNKAELIVTNTISNKMMKNHDSDYKVTSYEDKNQFLKSIISINSFIDKGEMFKNNRCIGGKIFKLEIIKKYDIKFDSNIHTFEDGFFIMEFVNKSQNILFYNNNIYYYREVKNSKTHRINEKNIKELENVVDKMSEELISMDLLSSNKEIFNYFILDSYRILCNYVAKLYGIKHVKKGINLLKQKYDIFLNKYYNNIKINSINSIKEKIIIYLLLKKKICLLYFIYLVK